MCHFNKPTINDFVHTKWKTEISSLPYWRVLKKMKVGHSVCFVRSWLKAAVHLVHTENFPKLNQSTHMCIVQVRFNQLTFILIPLPRTRWTSFESLCYVRITVVHVFHSQITLVLSESLKRWPPPFSIGSPHIQVVKAQSVFPSQLFTSFTNVSHWELVPIHRSQQDPPSAALVIHCVIHRGEEVDREKIRFEGDGNILHLILLLVKQGAS